MTCGPREHSPKLPLDLSSRQQSLSLELGSQAKGAGYLLRVPPRAIAHFFQRCLPRHAVYMCPQSDVHDFVHECAARQRIREPARLASSWHGRHREGLALR